MRRTPATGAAVAEVVLGRGEDVAVGFAAEVVDAAAVIAVVGRDSLAVGTAVVGATVIAGVPRAAVVVVGGAVVGPPLEQAVTSSVSAAHAAYRRVCR